MNTMSEEIRQANNQLNEAVFQSGKTGAGLNSDIDFKRRKQEFNLEVIRLEDKTDYTHAIHGARAYMCLNAQQISKVVRPEYPRHQKPKKILQQFKTLKKYMRENNAYFSLDELSKLMGYSSKYLQEYTYLFGKREYIKTPDYLPSGVFFTGVKEDKTFNLDGGRTVGTRKGKRNKWTTEEILKEDKEILRPSEIRKLVLTEVTKNHI